MIVKESIVVPASPEVAWAYVSDFTTAAEWDPGIASSVKTSEGPLAVGTTYVVEAVFRDRIVPFEYEVTELEPSTRLVLTGTGAKAVSVDTIVFEPAGTGTRILYEADFGMTGLFRLTEPFLRGTFRELAREALAGLESELSKRAATTTTDDRSVHDDRDP